MAPVSHPGRPAPASQLDWSCACDTVVRFCALSVLCWLAFPLAAPFAPPAPMRSGPLCSLASQLLWQSLTSHDRASMATACPRVRLEPQSLPQLCFGLCEILEECRILKQAG